MTDDEAIEALIATFLASVSFAEGERPDYDALPALFAEGAQLVRAIGSEPTTDTIATFIPPRQALVDSGELSSFSEVEVAHVTERFGNVAHRFSTYEKRAVTNGVASEAVGLISTQFVRGPHGWRISAMAWDDAAPGACIPERYRPG